MIELTIEGPGKNALGTTVMESLLSGLAQAGDAPILLTGAGDAFSAGLDLKEVVALDRVGMAAFLDTLERLVEALYLHPAPTVACVNGHAIAGGCVLALCCDHRVATAAPRTRIGLNEVALGVSYPPRVFAAVTQRLPAPAFERAVLGAGLHDPATALALALVDEVVADPAATARERLAELASHPPQGYAAAKRTRREPAMAAGRAEAAAFRETVVPTWCSPAVKDRLRSVLAPRR